MIDPGQQCGSKQWGGHRIPGFPPIFSPARGALAAAEMPAELAVAEGPPSGPRGPHHPRPWPQLRRSAPLDPSADRHSLDSLPSPQLTTPPHLRNPPTFIMRVHSLNLGCALSRTIVLAPSPPSPCPRRPRPPPTLPLPLPRAGGAAGGPGGGPAGAAAPAARAGRQLARQPRPVGGPKAGALGERRGAGGMKVRGVRGFVFGPIQATTIGPEPNIFDSRALTGS